MISQSDKKCFCVLEDFLVIIDRKWAIRILSVLWNRGEMSYNQLLKSLPGITPRSLSDTLKDLEERGLIERIVITLPTIRIYYRLTVDGKKFVSSLIPVLDWFTQKYGKNVSKKTCCNNGVKNNYYLF